MAKWISLLKEARPWLSYARSRWCEFMGSVVDHGSDRFNATVLKKETIEFDALLLRIDAELETWVCPDCHGDGIERCNNPDHGLIDALFFHDVGRLGCPVCGHDEEHRVQGSKCPTCDGTGIRKPDVKELIDELLEAALEDRLVGTSSPVRGLPIELSDRVVQAKKALVDAFEEGRRREDE